MSNYPTNLTDKQWQVIKNIVETQERKRKHPLQEMINAMIHITKAGWQCIIYTMLLNSHYWVSTATSKKNHTWWGTEIYVIYQIFAFKKSRCKVQPYIYI